MCLRLGQTLTHATRARVDRLNELYKTPARADIPDCVSLSTLFFLMGELCPNYKRRAYNTIYNLQCTIHSMHIGATRWGQWNYVHLQLVFTRAQRCFVSGPRKIVTDSISLESYNRIARLCWASIAATTLTRGVQFSSNSQIGYAIWLWPHKRVSARNKLLLCFPIIFQLQNSTKHRRELKPTSTTFTASPQIA